MIDKDGKQLGIFPIEKALMIAEEAGLDLVEVSPKASPPVCKIMDYGKLKYQWSKKRHEAKKKQTLIQVKEIKLRPTTDKHDLDIKIEKIKEFLSDKNKVKVVMRFRGRELIHKETGMEIMKNIADVVKELGSLESEPKMDGRNITMVLSPHHHH